MNEREVPVARSCMKLLVFVGRHLFTGKKRYEEGTAGAGGRREAERELARFVTDLANLRAGCEPCNTGRGAARMHAMAELARQPAAEPSREW